MDEKFTQKLQAWLQADPKARDWAEGVEMLLRLSGNRIEHRNLLARPGQRLDYIASRLGKYLQFRLARLTREQVADMTDKVEKAMEKADNPERKLGKRDDHDKLPPEIQALYEENFLLVARMRELHLRLRMINEQQAVCPDSERYPFLKELIKMDKRRIANWLAYDTYTLPANG